jgi:MFS family permease
MSEITASLRIAPATSEFRQGWTVVLACFCTATFAWGFGFYGLSVYFADLHATRGWPASLIASATTLYYLVGGLLLVWIHRAFALLGPRLLLVYGATILGVGAIALVRAQSPWELYVWAIVMAIGWTATTTTAIAMTLALWFEHRRGLALSLALNGASAGGFTVAPVLARLTEHIGLERAVPLLVLIALAILLPVLIAGVRKVPMIGANRPALAGQYAPLRNPHVWSIALPFALALAAQVGFIVHQMAFLLPHLGTAGAANAVAATAIAAAGGRLAMAPLIDRMNQRIASAASFAVQAAGLGLMLTVPDHPAALYVGNVLFGISVGNVITLPALIVQREFDPAAFGQVIGVVSMVGYTTLAFGPTLLGLAHDIAGSYVAAVALCVVLQLLAALMVLVGKPRHG